MRRRSLVSIISPNIMAQYSKSLPMDLHKSTFVKPSAAILVRNISSTADSDGDNSNSADEKKNPSRSHASTSMGRDVRGSMDEYLRKISDKQNAPSDSVWSKLQNQVTSKPVTRGPPDSKWQQRGAPRGQQEPGSSEFRSMNQRPERARGARPQRPRGPPRTYAAAGTAGAGGVGDQSYSPRSGERGRRPARGERDGYGGSEGGGYSSSAQIPASVDYLLRDHEFFAELVQSYKEIDTSRMDDVDAFFANSFTESFKTSDASHQEMLQFPALHRTRLPKARNMMQLLSFAEEPNVQTVPADSPGRQAAEEAWVAIHRNLYFSDDDKYRLMEGIAKGYNKVQALYDQYSDENAAKEVDLIMKAEFRPGRRYMEVERYQQMLANAVVTDDGEFIQENTNWDQEAVVDEDQL